MPLKRAQKKLSLQPHLTLLQAVRSLGGFAVPSYVSTARARFKQTQYELPLCRYCTTCVAPDPTALYACALNIIAYVPAEVCDCCSKWVLI